MDALGYLIGSGSMSLGIEAAGFNLREIWETPGYAKNAKTWNINRPHMPVNVLDLDHNNHTHFWNRLGGMGIDMIYGNPPCGGLSAMTCSRVDSPTNTCMRQWIRMVAPAGARMILMENAYQLATDRVGPLLKDLTTVLEHYGYHWWTWMFHSYQINCPQIRRRMFLCATKDPPVRQNMISLHDLPQGRKELCPVGPWLNDFVGVDPVPNGMAITRSGNAVSQHEYGRWKGDEWNSIIRNNWERIAGGYSTYKDLMRDYNKAATGDRVALKGYERGLKKYWPEAPKDFNGLICHRPHVLDWNSASHAIIGWFKYVQPFDRRLLTMREIARLMGYPDHWQFHEINPYIVAQGIPVINAYWAADRMLKVIGQR